jgi:hypothetical protein
MSIAHHLSTFGIPIVGVPKTIDNDLRYTDQTFGFDRYSFLVYLRFHVIAFLYIYCYYVNFIYLFTVHLLLCYVIYFAH